jgi:hypothetical protein
MEQISIEEYVKVKKYAYKFISYLTEKNKICGTGIKAQDIEEFIKGVCPYEIGSLEYQIFISTVYIPNDLNFIQECYKSKCSNASMILEELGLPKYMLGIVMSKILELKIYGLDKLIQQDIISPIEASLSESILYQKPLVIGSEPDCDKFIYKKLTRLKNK